MEWPCRAWLTEVRNNKTRYWYIPCFEGYLTPEENLIEVIKKQRKNTSFWNNANYLICTPLGQPIRGTFKNLTYTKASTIPLERLCNSLAGLPLTP